MSKSLCYWTHDDFIKDGMAQVFDVTRCRHYYRFNKYPMCQNKVRLTYFNCGCLRDCQNEMVKQLKASYYCRWYQEKQSRTVNTTWSTSGSCLSDPLSPPADGIN